MSGLLINGATVQVPGLKIITASEAPWAMLDPGDYRMRRARPCQVLLHTTKGNAPQHVIPGIGPGGMAERTARFWQRDPTHSAAHIVVDNNGDVACLADLARVEAYHATVSNPYSVGIELYQETDNGIYEAVFEAAVKLVPALCNALCIPFQVAADPYTGHPLHRFLDGGPDFCGVLGHRQNTEARGAGDPGDEIYRRLIAAGAEPVLAEQRQDITLGKQRQTRLNELDAKAGNTYRPLVVDGIFGPASRDAMLRLGFRSWRDVS